MPGYANVCDHRLPVAPRAPRGGLAAVSKTTTTRQVAYPALRTTQTSSEFDDAHGSVLILGWRLPGIRRTLKEFQRHDLSVLSC